ESLLALRQVKAGDQALRLTLEYPRRRQHEEIDPHRTPVQLAQAADAYRDRRAGDIELEHVAEPQPERPGQPLLHRGFLLRHCIEPFSGSDAIAVRQIGAPGEIEL